MYTEETVRRFGLLLSLQTVVEGMKAENKIREVLNHSLAYDEEAFNRIAFQMESIALEIK